jgi:RimJ/RimL family protein N-acetyltransferase
VDDQWISLRTPRLVLTPPTVSDAQHVLELLSDPQSVVHNPSDGLQNVDQATELLARWTRQWERYRFGYWCLRISEGGEFVGYAGVKTIRFRDGEALNLVYRLAPHAWSQGLGTEAASAVVAWAARHVPDRRLVARVRPENLASQRVAAKAGLQRVPSWDEEGEDGLDLIFSYPGPDVIAEG